MKKTNNGPILAVRAIIQDKDKRVLILKRSDEFAFGDLWCLPGGKIDFGQTAKESVAREVKEETALICRACKFLFYMDGLPEKEGDNHYLTLYFACQADGAIEINRESSEFVWVRPGDIGKYEIAFGNDEAIREYLK
jgi:mutator protein MutT